MPGKKDEKNKKDYCSTSEAAHRLGVSMGTVQQMVENGVLEAWKTVGGHRRILLTSVDALLGHGRAGAQVARVDERVRLLIAEDDAVLQQVYRHAIETWALPLDLRMVSNGFDALLEIGGAAPDLLITDLRMPGVDGFEMIRRIRERKLAEEMDIIVVSVLSEDEILESGGLPQDVTIYGKPLPLRELNGYVQALVARRRRASDRLSAA